jgi:peptide-methionine (S)-S-oxide reductase
MERLATFGAGCFWGVEAAFRRLEGVSKTRAGYAGGNVDHPTYKEVCSDRTGHAEVVEVTYDDEQVPYEQLLAVFWAEHDPTQVNRQGPDVGSQYRSVIFVHDDEQRVAAERSRERVQSRLGRPVATSIEDAPPFWEAEDYHQQYLEKRGLASCTVRLAGVVS